MDEEDELDADLENGQIRNLTKGQDYAGNKLPSFLLNILKAGGAAEAYKQWNRETRND